MDPALLEVCAGVGVSPAAHTDLHAGRRRRLEDVGHVQRRVGHDYDRGPGGARGVHHLVMKGNIFQ